MKAVGVDIGGTNIEAGLVNSRGKILKRVSVKTEASKGRKVVLKNIFNAIDKVITKDVKGIGVGAPGPIDLKKGSIGKTVHMPLHNVPLRKIIKERFRKPVFFDNDANCFTFGESVFGAAKGMKNVVGLTIGTGVGSGIIINKQIYHGRNNAGELGHIIINFDGLKDTKGISGSLENHVGKLAIKRYSKGIAKNPLELYEKAAKGNYKAERIWGNVGKYLGVGIISIIHGLDPDVVVVGGNISKAWRFFNGSMKQEMKKRSLFKPCAVVKSKLGDKAAVLGAASLVFIPKNIYRN